MPSPRDASFSISTVLRHSGRTFLASVHCREFVDDSDGLVDTGGLDSGI
jgi:hypothetical protein